MARVLDWAERLNAVVTAEQTAPQFLWGAHDCATFYRHIVKAVTGEDPLIDIPPWRNERGALRALHSAGVDSVRDFIAQRHKSKPAALAGRGDLGFTADRDRLTFPAVILGAIAMQRAPDGIVVFDRSFIVEAYEV